jgi:hypothetical protein
MTRIGREGYALCADAGGAVAESAARQASIRDRRRSDIVNSLPRERQGETTCEEGRTFALLLPLQGEKVGMRGSIRES